MKKTLLVLMVCIAVATIGSAQEEVPIIDSIVQYYYVDGNDSIRFWKWEYQFNATGKEIYHAIYNSWTGSRWKLFEEQQNIFNEKGDTIKKFEHHTLEHGLHYPYVKHEWEYDNNGIILYRYIRD